ncbi:MAG: DUF1499 domain-containing protein [Hyphomicrobiaceae bacterium]
MSRDPPGIPVDEVRDNLQETKQAMTIARIEGAPTGPRWTTRLALFALVLLLAAIVLHRFLGLATETFLALMAISFLLSALAASIGILSAVGIWRRGGPGTARVAVGMAIAGGILAWPLYVGATLGGLPEINDVTTAPDDPPAFEVLAKARKGRANGAEYPADRFADLQLAAFPDIATLEINRAVEETYDLVLEALRREGLTVVRDSPPAPDSALPGAIEAVDRTLVLGFYDDVVVRVASGGEGTLVDIRSASRFGRHDLGRNATRIRTLMRGIVKRLESTVPGAVARSRPAKPDATGVKPGERGRRARDADRRREPRRPQ